MAAEAAAAVPVPGEATWQPTVMAACLPQERLGKGWRKRWALLQPIPQPSHGEGGSTPSKAPASLSRTPETTSHMTEGMTHRAMSQGHTPLNMLLPQKTKKEVRRMENHLPRLQR